jgi:hypothetical protein
MLLIDMMFQGRRMQMKSQDPQERTASQRLRSRDEQCLEHLAIRSSSKRQKMVPQAKGTSCLIADGTTAPVEKKATCVKKLSAPV